MAGWRRWRGAVVAVVLALGLATPIVAAGAAPPPRLQAPSSTERFVRAAYADLAGREPTASELGSAVQALGSGTSRTQVAQDLTHGSDHAGQVVDRLYVRILGRDADPGGRAFWTARLASGVGVRTLASQLYGSREYFASTGSTPGSFVDAVYADLLGRPADPSGRAYWTARVAGGESRTVLSRLLFSSRESNGLRIVLMYLDLLRRLPEASARAYWAEQLVGTDDLEVEARLVGSTEYLDDAQDPEGRRVTTLTRGERGSGDPEISGDGRLVVFTSRDDLAPGPVSGQGDVVLFDRVTGRFRNLTQGLGGNSADISADGTTVVFSSAAALVPGDTNGVADVFRLRLDETPLQRLTAGDGPSRTPRVDGDGSTVVFSSTASDLVTGDDNGAVEDVFVHTQGDTAVERVGGDGPTTLPAISADGSAIAFLSVASDLVAGDDDGRTDVFHAPLPDPMGGPVVLISEGDAGVAIPRGRPSLSADGALVGYNDLSSSEAPGTGFVATVGPGGIDRRPLDPGPDGGGQDTTVSVEVSDDGSATYQDQVTIRISNPPFRGIHQRGDETTIRVIAPHGSLTADGTLVAADTSTTSVPGPPSQIVLWDLG